MTVTATKSILVCMKKNRPSSPHGLAWYFGDMVNSDTLHSQGRHYCKIEDVQTTGHKYVYLVCTGCELDGRVYVEGIIETAAKALKNGEDHIEPKDSDIPYWRVKVADYDWQLRGRDRKPLVQ